VGVVNRLKKRVKGSLALAKTVVDAVREEARHPGRPPSSMAADSPFWKDDPQDSAHAKARDGIEAARAAAPPAPPAPPAPVDTEGRDGETFWFLKDGADAEGWDTTNPSEEWRERHGDTAARSHR
jgi:hypothetical protein